MWCPSSQFSSSSFRFNNYNKCNNWISWKNPCPVWNIYMVSAWMAARNACSIIPNQRTPSLVMLHWLQELSKLNHCRRQQLLELQVRMHQSHLNTSQMSVCPRSIWTRWKTILTTRRSQTWTWYRHWWSKCPGSWIKAHPPAKVDINTMEVLISSIFKVFWALAMFLDEAMVVATVILIQWPSTVCTQVEPISTSKMVAACTSSVQVETSTVIIQTFMIKISRSTAFSKKEAMLSLADLAVFKWPQVASIQ